MEILLSALLVGLATLISFELARLYFAKKKVSPGFGYKLLQSFGFGTED